MLVTEDDLKELEVSRPADYSFKKLRKLEEMALSEARTSRLGAVPQKGSLKEKFLTRSVWVNNNRLKSTRNLNVFVESIVEYPELLAWIDFSFNRIKTIDESLAHYPNLKIVYMHGNCIDSFDEILKLRDLKQLRTVTFHGNPISNETNYRSFVVNALPQVVNLDFTSVVKSEKIRFPPPELAKLLKAQDKFEPRAEETQ